MEKPKAKKTIDNNMAYRMKGWKGFDLSKHPVKPPTTKQGGKPIGVKNTTTGISNISLFPKVGGSTNKKTN